MDHKLIDTLLAARAQRGGGAADTAAKGRPDVHVDLGGRLSARARLAALLDPGSEVEYGAVAARDADSNWIGEDGGVDFIGSIDGLTVIASSTNYDDRGGGYGAARLPRLYSLAIERRWPVVQFVDGGGSRARHPRSGLGHLELSGPVGRFTLFDGMAELSGWAPTVAIVSGPAFAGHASLAGFSDFLIATRGSSIGMGGPPMVEAALGKRLSPQELAGVEMHAEGGGIDLLVDDEQAAVAAARRYLSYWRDRDTGEASALAERIDTLVPDSGPYDVRDVVLALADADSVLELRPQFAGAVVTALARFGGRSVGVLASQPLIDDGAIDEAAAVKIARFVELCNAYGYPLLVLVDSPGCLSSWRQRDGSQITETGLTRWHLRCISAHQQRSVPLLSVQLRRARGLAPALLCGAGNESGLPALTLAWPTTELGQVDGFGNTLSRDSFDDVVAPHETRERIVRVLRLYGPRPPPAAHGRKAHPIDTW